MAVHGMDPMQFLDSEDQFQVAVMQSIVKRAAQIQEDIDRRRANFIAEAVSKLFP